MDHRHEIALAAQTSRDWADTPDEKRWPLLHTALFTLGASLGLWAIIIAGVRLLAA